MGKVILDLCGGTGAWSDPYKQAGYEVLNITLPDYDVCTWRPDGLTVHGVLAAPPCQEFSFAKHFHGKGKYQHNFLSGLHIVSNCLLIIALCQPKWWALENPRGYLRRFLGLPQLTFDPCDYGDTYKKKTDLWGSFSLPVKNPVVPAPVKFSMLHSKDIHPEWYGKLNRTERRAITPSGFAQAFMQVNP